MLRQNSITTVVQSPAVTNLDDHLLPGTESLIEEIERHLTAGEAINNPMLTETADRVFGGSRAQGTYTPRDAYDALETAVNNLLLEGRAERLMQMSFADAIADLRQLTQQLPRQSDRTFEQTQFQQFSTPPTIAFLAAKCLNTRSTDTVLEPSAGTGSLAIWPRAIGSRVVCNEINSKRRALLRDVLGFETHQHDAEFIDDLLDAQIQPSAILMNPPFSSTGGRVAHNSTVYGARHVESAMRRLRDGGRLVAIMGEGLSLDKPAFSDWWKRMARLYNVRANLRIDGKEYGKYGTTFDIQIIVIDKDGPTPGDNWTNQLGNIRWGDAGTLEDAWESLRVIATPDPADDPEGEPEKAVFVAYTPARLKGGRPHPAPIVESASMAAVLPPEITYRPHLSREIVTEGRLSNIQLERIIYAGQRHEQRLPNGARAGFYVGDGTGVGKGRILAGIVADNYNQNRQRALWLSVNNDLLESTRRDLTDLGTEIPLARINDYPAAGEITLTRGVIFSSYSSLISTARNGAKRLDQIQRWLGPDGVVIFDEAHKAKNALASGRGEPTQTGQAVIDLQDCERNPNYRVVYSSATGATDVRNMAYMVRLGLWGPSTAFPGGFTEFLTEVDSGGVGAMEMVSRDLKSLGIYASGSISFGTCPNSGKAVDYRERTHYLTPQQREMYNRAAAAWQCVLNNIREAIEVTNGGRAARRVAHSKFWGDHQKFFRQTISAMKVPTVIEETEKALVEGKSVVISLIGTGESRTREQVARATASGSDLADLDFTPREVIASMVDRGFPTTLYQDVTDHATGKVTKEPVRDVNGNIVQSRQALEIKQSLIDGLSALDLPENPLDQLVNHFGEKNVAELTGRTRRLIRDPQTGRIEYKKRAPDGIPMDRVNIHEMEMFQSGKKRIAIISDAASTGISLHASNRALNKQRRVHITLELGWSADRQMQTFGRTHRSDQAVPPEYVLVSTELGGEKRFSSTIARRLGSLGALTKGDRGAADAGDLAKYNFETDEGRAALSLLLSSIMQGGEVPGLENPLQTLRDMGLLTTDPEGGEDIRKEDLNDVPRFLNRVLALDCERQSAVFSRFSDLFDQTLRHAKANGTFDEGITDIKALAVRIARTPRIVHKDEITGAETTHYVLDLDQPTKAVSFNEAENVRAKRGGAFMRHLKKVTFILAIESGRHTDPETGRSYKTYGMWQPEGAHTRYIHEDELNGKYQPVTPDTAREWWSESHASIPAIKTVQTHIIAGAIIPLWRMLKTSGARLRVVRVTTDDGQRIVGVEIAKDRLARVLSALGLSRTVSDPRAVFSAVLNEGDEITLASNLRLRQGRLHAETAIELCGADPYKFAELRSMGMINEQIQFKQRFFVPTDEEKGMAILTDLLKRYPVLADEETIDDLSVDDTKVEASIYATTLNMIDLDEWAIEPTGTIPTRETETSTELDHQPTEVPQIENPRANQPTAPATQTETSTQRPQPQPEPTKQPATSDTTQSNQPLSKPTVQMVFSFSAASPAVGLAARSRKAA